MRKQFFLLSLFLFATLTTWAERIDVATARKVAQHVATQQAGSGLRSADDLSVVYAAAPGKQVALRSFTDEGDADYFVFNVGTDRGFVIVSGEDRVRPVLGYADKGTFDPDNLPDNMRAWLANYQEQITWAADHLDTASSEVSAEWNRYLGAASLRAENGVLLETAAWNQYDPYNLMTPEISGEHALTGCVATAMGIIMKYHNYPQRAVNPPASNSYQVDGVYEEHQIDYTADYDWDNMLLSYHNGFTEAQANAVATLLYHCGANVEMNYGKNESTAFTKLVASALTDVFGYSPSVRYLRKEAYRWEEWKSMIREELDAKRPLIYEGRNSSGGHAFICDGYQDDFFHINWGWGGYQNGYFILSTLDAHGDGDGYSENPSMILNIIPNTTGSKYVYLPYIYYANYVVNSSIVEATINIKYSGIENQSVYMELGVIDSDGNIVQAPMISSLFTLEANRTGLNAYKVISRSITLSSALAEGQKVVMLCSTDGTNWEPMRREDSVSPGVDMNGVIGAEPDNPDEPLYVKINWNNFETQTYSNVTGLENIQTDQNIRAVSYKLSNAKGAMTLRYLISDFATWKDKLAIYHGVDNDLQYEGYGTKVDIHAEGYFDIVVPTSSIENDTYINFLKILSDQSGQLDLDIQVYAGSSTSPVFESKGQKIVFVNQFEIPLVAESAKGEVNKAFSFSLKPSLSEAIIAEKELIVSLILSGISEEHLTLYNANGDEIALTKAYETNETVLLTAPISIMGKQLDGYKFTLYSDAVVNQGSIYVNYCWINNEISLLATEKPFSYTITEAVQSTYKIQTDLTDLSLSDNTPTSVKEGSVFECNLLCNKEGYRVPQSILVTMGGKELTAGTVGEGDYTYNIESDKQGWIYIKSVTGNVKITAQAEAITHLIALMQADHLTSDMPTTKISIAEGLSFEFTLTPDAGYERPKTISILDQNDDAFTDFTYDSSTGKVKINKVTTDLKIYAIATKALQQFTIGATLTNLTATPDITTAQTVQEGSSFTFTLKAAVNYRLPDAIIILDGETQLTAGTDYTYDNATGKVTITTVKANLKIQAAGIDNQDLQVVFDLAGVIAEPQSVGPFKINTKPTFTVNFKAAEGYTYDDQITVKMGDKVLTAGTDYVYVADNDAFELKVDLTATLTITAKATKNSYGVTTSLENLTASEVSMVEHGEPLAITLTPETGYNLPEDVTVTMSGETLTGDAYVYDKAAGTIKIVKVTGPITIKAAGVLKQYLVQVDLAGLTTEFVSGTKVNHGSEWSITLTPTDMSLLPESITIQQDGKDLESTAYTYNAQTGEVTIAQVLGNIVVFAQGVAKPIYTVALIATGIQSPDLPESIRQGDAFEVTLTAKKGYTLPATVSVKMGDKELTASEYAYDPQTGAFKIAKVTGNLSITLDAVPNTYTLSIALTDCTADVTDGAEITHDQSLTIQLKADEGYSLPSTITVEIAGDYTYDPATGTLVIAKVAGDIKVTVVALKNQVIDPSKPNKIEGNSQVMLIEQTPEITVTSTATVEIKATEESTVKELNNEGATTIVGTAKVTIDGDVANTGTLTISEETNVSVTGTITNNGVFEDLSGKTTKVASNNGVSMEITNKPAASASYEKDKSLTLEVSVKVEDGQVPTFNWQKLVNGAWTDLVISSNLRSTTETSQYTVQNDNEGSYRCVITVANDDDATKKTVLVAKTTVTTTTPSTPVDPTPVDPTPIDPTPIDPVVTYTVTLPVVEGALIETAGSTTVTAGKSFSFTITVKEGYDATNMVVKANGTTLTPDASGRYTITNVSSNVIVTVTGLVSATANKTLEAQAVKVWTTNGQVHIYLPQDSKVQVVTFGGRLYQDVELPAGETVMPLPQGAYIIRIGETSYKVVL